MERGIRNYWNGKGEAGRKPVPAAEKPLAPEAFGNRQDQGGRLETDAIGTAQWVCSFASFAAEMKTSRASSGDLRPSIAARQKLLAAT